jgi:hypothetical protein
MKQRAVKLSSSGMANITKSRIGNDFTFIIGGRRHNCPWFVAEFLSPKVGCLHSVNATVGEIHIEVYDVRNDFESIISVVFGSNLFMTREPHSVFLSIACELNNWKLYFPIGDVMQNNVIISEFCQKCDD